MLLNRDARCCTPSRPRRAPGMCTVVTQISAGVDEARHSHIYIFFYSFLSGHYLLAFLVLTEKRTRGGYIEATMMFSWRPPSKIRCEYNRTCNRAPHYLQVKLGNRLGYCQHTAWAMASALLLRFSWPRLLITTEIRCWRDKISRIHNKKGSIVTL